MPPTPTTSPPEAETPVARLIGVGLLTRLVTDTGVQLFFPFLDIIALGLGTTPVVVGRLVSLRSLMGLFAPFFGNLAERRGYRPTMRLSLLLGGSGFLTIGLSQSIWLAALGMILAGLGGFSFVPTLQAYLSNRLPYHQRARGLGVLEYAWALAGIIGLLFAGQLLELTSWRVPFFIIGGCLLLASLLYGRLPESGGQPESATIPPTGRPRFNFRTYLNLGDNATSTFATIATGSLLMFGAFNTFISYGSWLSRDYGLGAAALGQVAFILGLSDLTGSVSVSLFSDRLRKRRSVLLGASLACVGFWLLPTLNIGLIPAVAALFFARAAFEFAIVANMALLSEQVPLARAKTLSLGAAFAVFSTSLAGLVSPALFSRFGIAGIGALSGTAALLAVFMLLWRVREPVG